MQPTVFLGLGAIAAFVTVKFVLQFLRRGRNAIKAKQLGCQELPFFNPLDVTGFWNVYGLMSADKVKAVPQLVLQRWHDISKKLGYPVGAMRLNVAGDTIIFTSEPKNIQAMLATKFKDFSLGPRRIDNLEPLLGHGIFAADGKNWEYSRALLRPQFARELVSDLDLEEVHMQKMMKALPVNPDGWTSVIDVGPLFFRLTLDSATEFLFGESVDSQLAALPGYAVPKTTAPERDEKVFAYAFDKAQWYLAQGARLDTKYWLMHTKTLKQHCSEVHAFVDYFVQMALSREKGAEAPKTANGKDKYVFLNALADETRDPVLLRDQLLNILLAGRDTTASLLSWTVWLLAQHPAVWEKLRSVILEDFGSYEDPAEISFSRLKSCKYLQQVINEVLRLYPVVPLNSRRSIRDTTLPRGGGPTGDAPIFVPAGTEVNYSVYVMHHRTDIWGADADDFKPERWEGRRPGWEYLPFNGGPRICLGQQFALTEASYVLVRLLQRFDKVEGVGVDSRPVRHGLTLTDAPADGVRVRLREESTAAT
ncbi:cytochrome P450 52A12 [Phyllosticta citrichinensis]|uniref:Cytochrome P450 52A12 n=1 Tax=Phyllosticta citrichinensis TaxID=1130410 RepID=A0ABR1Y1R9_9PEZI